MFERKGGWSQVPDDIEMGGGGGGGGIDYDTVVRNGFIRKVFGILSVQLLLTVLISIPIIAVDSIKSFIFANPWVLYLALALSFGFLIALVCVPQLIHSYPTNYILLFAFTICEGFMVGTISASYDTSSVVIAAGITLGISVGLTLFATQTKWDFTMFGGMLFSLLLGLCLMGFLTIFFKNNVYTLVYSSIGAVLFSAYLVYDVQMIVGGKRFELGVDDYIPAALHVYLDVINLFLFILRILNNR